MDNYSCETKLSSFNFYKGTIVIFQNLKLFQKDKGFNSYKGTIVILTGDEKVLFEKLLQFL